MSRKKRRKRCVVSFVEEKPRDVSMEEDTMTFHDAVEGEYLRQSSGGLRYGPTMMSVQTQAGERLQMRCVAISSEFDRNVKAKVSVDAGFANTLSGMMSEVLLVTMEFGGEPVQFQASLVSIEPTQIPLYEPDPMYDLEFIAEG